jgi:hypothetical protein
MRNSRVISTNKYDGLMVQRPMVPKCSTQSRAVNPTKVPHWISDYEGA